jgi:hypothetical protein
MTDLDALAQALKGLKPEQILALAQAAKAKTPKPKANATKAPKPPKHPFRELKAPPIRTPSRQVTDAVSERKALMLRAAAPYHPTRLAHATYEDRHFVGIYPATIEA